MRLKILYIRKIILALLSTGEAYIVDLRNKYRGRYELIEPVVDNDDVNRIR